MRDQHWRKQQWDAADSAEEQRARAERADLERIWNAHPQRRRRRPVGLMLAWAIAAAAFLLGIHYLLGS